MSHPIPVILIKNDGSRTADIVNGQPCINLRIGYDQQVKDGTAEHPALTMPAVGILDTGAQGIICDARLVGVLASPALRQVNSRTSHGNRTITGHELRVHIPEASRTLRVLVFADDLRAAGNPYDLLLGRDFLRFFTFDWRADEGLVSLRLLGAERKAKS